MKFEGIFPAEKNTRNVKMKQEWRQDVSKEPGKGLQGKLVDTQVAVQDSDTWPWDPV